MAVRNVADPPGADLQGPAYLLPPEAYWDADWFARERRHLFAASWLLAAHVADLPADGGYLPVEVNGAPVLLTRTAQGDVRAFANMCRHRGMALACEPGAGDRVRCPYHGWEFGLDGALERVPQRAAQFPGLDSAAWGLVPLACARWGEMVFVNPDGTAPPIEEWLADLPDHIGPFPQAGMVQGFRKQFPLACNWKLYVENHIDCYHLWYLHEASLGMNDHHALVYRDCGDHWICAEPLRPGQDRVRPGMVALDGMDGDEGGLTRANLIFPNVPQTSMATTFSTYQVIPTGPETCTLDLRIWVSPESEVDDTLADGAIEILVTEDGFACEQMQRVVRSPSFGVGPLARVHERPIAELHRKILRHLEPRREPTP